MVLNQRREFRCKPPSILGPRVLEAERFKSFTSVALGPKQSAIEPIPAGSLLNQHCSPRGEGQMYHNDGVIGGQNSQFSGPRFLNHNSRRGGFLSASRSRGVKITGVERHPA